MKRVEREIIMEQQKFEQAQIKYSFDIFFMNLQKEIQCRILSLRFFCSRIRFYSRCACILFFRFLSLFLSLKFITFTDSVSRYILTNMNEESHHAVYTFFSLFFGNA